MEKTGIEAVAGTHRVDGIYFLCRTDEAFVPALRYGSGAAELHNDNGNQFSQFANRDLEIIGSRCLPRLPLVRKKDVDIAQDVVKAALPFIVRIVVGVEGDGKSSRL